MPLDKQAMIRHSGKACLLSHALSVTLLNVLGVARGTIWDQRITTTTRTSVAGQT